MEEALGSLQKRSSLLNGLAWPLLGGFGEQGVEGRLPEYGVVSIREIELIDALNAFACVQSKDVQWVVADRPECK